TKELAPDAEQAAPTEPPAEAEALGEDTPLAESALAEPQPKTVELPAEPPMNPNAIALRDYESGWTIRADFWYMSKRRKSFAAVVPEVWANDRLPGLPESGWHLARPRRFQQELDLLADAGYNVDIGRWDAGGRPGRK